MQIDFNANFKNYLSYSKVYRAIRDKVKEEDSYKESTKEEQDDYLMAVKAVMELAVINPDCFNNMEFKNRDIVCLLKGNNSKEINEYYHKKYDHKLDHNGFFVKSLVRYYFTHSELSESKNETKKSLSKTLEKEIAQFNPNYKAEPVKIKMK